MATYAAMNVESSYGVDVQLKPKHFYLPPTLNTTYSSCANVALNFVPSGMSSSPVLRLRAFGLKAYATRNALAARGSLRSAPVPPQYLGYAPV